MKPLLLILTLALAACSGDAWQAKDVGDLSPADAARLARAQAAAKTLGTRLMGTLVAAMAEGGPVGAIEVCRTRAREFAAEESAGFNGRVGRTSHRLRNQENRPPDWLADLAAEEPRIYLGPDGRMGVALPIRMKTMCLACHGPAADLDPELVAKLTELYPDDQAKNFAEGEIRGQFWVELPAESK